MLLLSSILSLTHLIGLALALGSATVKLVLLARCSADQAFVPVYLKVARPITRQIVLGLVLLTLSGIGWLLLAYAITWHLILKPLADSRGSDMDPRTDYRQGRRAQVREAGPGDWCACLP
jgi:hypothetical protein